ncbi:trehalase family glycosidase [Pseudoalteromonas 'SMAR']|uniref:trehalase family glycosidase n=1 Tax=Pseudoalteromonas 'SMAR' TaxID=3416908 RepID=UPI003AF2C3E1
MQYQSSFYSSKLFKAVQQAGIFADSKTFADAVANSPVDEIEAQFALQQPKGQDLLTFVQAHFTFQAATELQALPRLSNAKQYIAELWQRLSRQPSVAAHGSLLPLPYPYVVPGGRFNEIYYWDSYFTALGLMDAGREDLAAGMLNNFISLINSLGHVPNGNRDYYQSRSQPPVTALMVDLLWQQVTADRVWLETVTHALEKEYAFWMAMDDEGSEQLAQRRVVNMPCGGRLNRYWDPLQLPRPESFKEDLELAQSASNPGVLYQHIRAACESGWDFSSRWLADPQSLSSIRTTDIVPVDLNALMLLLEKQLEKCWLQLAKPQQAEYYGALAEKRQALLQQYFWCEQHGWYFDLDLSDFSRTRVSSLAAAAVLFAKVPTPQQAQQMAANIERRFLKQGGLVTTLNHTEQQWDAPNGWAPLQWFAVAGLINYGETKLAKAIMRAWLYAVETGFEHHGCLLEKYNVEHPEQRASGGEYVVQQGFGWTNGVSSRFYHLLENGFDTLSG